MWALYDVVTTSMNEAPNNVFWGRQGGPVPAGVGYTGRGEWIVQPSLKMA